MIVYLFNYFQCVLNFNQVLLTVVPQPSLPFKSMPETVLIGPFDANIPNSQFVTAAIMNTCPVMMAALGPDYKKNYIGVHI